MRTKALCIHRWMFMVQHSALIDLVNIVYVHSIGEFRKLIMWCTRRCFGNVYSAFSLYSYRIFSEFDWITKNLVNLFIPTAKFSRIFLDALLLTCITKLSSLSDVRQSFIWHSSIESLHKPRNKSTHLWWWPTVYTFFERVTPKIFNLL